MEIRKEERDIARIGKLVYTLSYSDVSGQYGISAEKASTGEAASFADISPDKAAAFAIFEAIVRGTVTPVTLGDVIYDLLCI